jgi:cytochrome oxidase Cu insertion factor (SCO1/SenC/PrrC family)
MSIVFRMAPAVLLAVLLASCMRLDTHPNRGPARNREAQDISGTDADGRSFRLSEYRGQVVLLEFWRHD